jgi:hypothetical protein
MDPDRQAPRSSTRAPAPRCKRAVACHIPIRPEGRARTLSGPSPDLSPARTIASSARMPTAGFCLRSAYRSRSDAGGALDSFRLA